MLSPKRYLMELSRKIFKRERELFAVAGTPIVLGQGLDEPCIQPKLAVHWHPPFSMLTADATGREKGRLRAWLTRVGVWRKTA